MFGERLRKLRQQADLKQSELAKKLDLSVSTIGMYEQGRRHADQETLVKISKIFNVSVDYLIGVEPDDKKVKPATEEDKEVDEFMELYEQLNGKNKEAILNLMKNLLGS